MNGVLFPSIGMPEFLVILAILLLLLGGATIAQPRSSNPLTGVGETNWWSAKRR